jgi:hypothetical protein
MALRTMTIEPVRAFNGLDVLVARDEGLFAEEGLDLRIATLSPGDVRSTAEGTLAQPESVAITAVLRKMPLVPFRLDDVPWSSVVRSWLRRSLPSSPRRS